MVGWSDVAFMHSNYFNR
jgi:hypothetical protein